MSLVSGLRGAISNTLSGAAGGGAKGVKAVKKRVNNSSVAKSAAAGGVMGAAPKNVAVGRRIKF